MWLACGMAGKMLATVATAFLINCGKRKDNLNYTGGITGTAG